VRLWRGGGKVGRGGWYGVGRIIVVVGVGENIFGCTLCLLTSLRLCLRTSRNFSCASVRITSKQNVHPSILATRIRSLNGPSIDVRLLHSLQCVYSQVISLRVHCDLHRLKWLTPRRDMHGPAHRTLRKLLVQPRRANIRPRRTPPTAARLLPNNGYRRT